MLKATAKTNDVPGSNAGLLSRRRFISATGIAAAAVWLTPRWLIAEETSPALVYSGV